jgi:glycolate oxidase FAD binding subunit
MSRFAPADLHELRDAIGDALAVEEPLEVVGGGSKRGLGRPLQLPRMLDLSSLAGIRDYQPGELVLSAGAATPLEEIDAVLTEARQMLAFEPPDFGALYGLPASVAGRRTLGGAIACNLSGPRRIREGAARDHFLGFRAVSGRGEVFKAGGKVVKNVTGYDLCKLMSGSHGTLAALEEVTVRVLPQPEALSTVMLCGLDAAAAVRKLSRSLASPHEVSGAVYVPAPSAAGFKQLSGLTAVVALRLEGPLPSVVFRRERLLAELGSDCETNVLDDGTSVTFWRAIRDVLPLAGFRDRTIWRVSVAPSRGAELAEVIERSFDASWYLDWAGGLIWAAIAGADDGGAAVLRAAIRGADGCGTGHATLIKGSPELRRSVPVFEPQPPALASLANRIKEAFDPRRILNPGRMVEGC